MQRSSSALQERGRRARNKAIRAAILLALSGTLLSPAAHANAVPFQASGTFQDGSILSGMIVIDTVLGTVLSGDLAITGHVTDFTTFALQRTWPPSSPFLYETGFLNAQPTGNDLTFLFPPVSLVGYSGGILCSVNNICKDATLQYFSNFSTLSGGFTFDFVELREGSLAPIPEPSLMVVCLAGMLAIVAGRALARRRS